MSKELNEYPWEKTLSKYQRDKIESKFYENQEKVLSFEGLNNFVYEFSPLNGCLGLGGRKRRTRKDAIEFIAKTGLVDNEKEAERFLDEIKNHTFYVFPPYSTGLVGKDYFTLTELRNSNGCVYEAAFGGDLRS
jgi:hypothetical protein